MTLEELKAKSTLVFNFFIFLHILFHILHNHGTEHRILNLLNSNQLVLIWQFWHLPHLEDFFVSVCFHKNHIQYVFMNI